jgi:hypothetical protein
MLYPLSYEGGMLRDGGDCRPASGALSMLAARSRGSIECCGIASIRTIVGALRGQR